ncbi:MAG: class I SAM-dependent DNA methyltransferase [Chitinophagales bacterium]
MALSWNEIKSRTISFMKEWEDEHRERAEKDTFWNDFFNIFGISRRRVATFEAAVKKLNDKSGFIDLFWPGTLLIEHKSKGKNLDKAYEQALDYLHGLKEHELPKYVLVSDFQRFKLVDLDTKEEHEFELKDLLQHIGLFGFIAGYKKRVYEEGDPVNVEAAYLMGELHDSLKEIGYDGHALEVYLVRLLFCFFADDTSIFEKGIFQEYIETQTKEDGSNLAMYLAQLFQTLNKSPNKRFSNLDESLNQFPYVNGQLFEEMIPLASFDTHMRNMILKASALDWGKISPAIFGSMFQAAMNPKQRRNLGAHYTSEKNIQKLIRPLFLDNLYVEFEKAKKNTRQLKALHKKIASLTFLDPACGCGNFLIVTYRELRTLELEILKILQKRQRVFDVRSLIQVNIYQFFGIEYEEFAARVAELALWLVEHQMNMKMSEAFGEYIINIPLREAATIKHGNALELDWNSLVKKNKLHYILGNPPFVGKKEQNDAQKADMKRLFVNVKGNGVLDYVTAWYLKAAQFIQKTKIKVAFVSTNSIAQGEQVGVLWHELFSKNNISIHFAHRPFKWQNEAKGNAAVHCVIIGFANFDTDNKKIFDYEDIKGEPTEIKAKNINSYLVDAANIVIAKQQSQIAAFAKMNYGNMPIDNGHLILSDEERKEAIAKEPFIEPYILKYIGGFELINNVNRWCLWLKNISPNVLKKSKFIKERIKKTQTFRKNSNRKTTNKLAHYPSLFGEIRQSKFNYLAVPKVSSENREYIPMAIFTPNVIASGSCLIIPKANFFLFGIMTSQMHNTWIKYTCGRMKSDYQYSSTIVYNNFPFPKDILPKNKKKVSRLAKKILDMRAKYSDSSLADLYNPLMMPADLRKAHTQLDKAVDLCYRPQAFTNERNRIAYLFDLYDSYVRPLLQVAKKKKKASRKKI